MTTGIVSKTANVRRSSKTSPRTNARDLYGTSLTANYTFANDATLTSISAFRGLKFNSLGDVDSTPLDLLGIGSKDNLSQYSQEIRYASSNSTPFKYVIGGYYFSQDAKSNRAFLLGDDLVGIFVGGGVPAAFLTPAAVRTISRIRTSSLAAFVNASYDITDALTFNAGVRYSTETKRLSISQTSPIALQGNFLDFGLSKDRQKSSDFSPTFGISYKLSDRVNTYLRYSKGFKSGGWNAELVSSSVGVFDNAGNVTGANLGAISFKPESIENYEFGFKSEWLDRKIRFNLALFLQNFSDIQVSTFVGGVVGFATRNAASARSTGFEAEFSARPTRNLDLSINLGYANSRYLSFPNADSNGADLSGRSLQTPRWTATVSGQYSLPVSDTLSIVAGADYSYRSRRPGDPLDPTSGVPGFGLLDARIGLEFGDKWNIFLWGKNVFAKDYLADRGTSSTSQLVGLIQSVVNYGDPRTYGVRASLKF